MCGRGEMGGEGSERITEGMDMIKEHYLCVWECHNETLNSVRLIHTNKMMQNADVEERGLGNVESSLISVFHSKPFRRG